MTGLRQVNDGKELLEIECTVDGAGTETRVTSLFVSTYSAIAYTHSSTKVAYIKYTFRTQLRVCGIFPSNILKFLSYFPPTCGDI